MAWNTPAAMPTGGGLGAIMDLARGSSAGLFFWRWDCACLSGLPVRNRHTRRRFPRMIECRADSGTDCIGERAQRVNVAADIPAGHSQRLVAENVANQEGVGAGGASVGADVLELGHD